MATREQLQTKLEELLKSRNVYYQPPATVRISYPAIVYFKDIIKKDDADDTMYKIGAIERTICITMF